jgi:hypothetical protein
MTNSQLNTSGQNEPPRRSKGSLAVILIVAGVVAVVMVGLVITLLPGLEAVFGGNAH